MPPAPPVTMAFRPFRENCERSQTLLDASFVAKFRVSPAILTLGIVWDLGITDMSLLEKQNVAVLMHTALRMMAEIQESLRFVAQKYLISERGCS